MSGKIRVLVMGMTQICSLISMKKKLLYDQLLTSSALLVQSQENALPLEFLKKSGEYGEEYFLKVEKSLENSPNTGAEINGLKLGRV